MKLLIIRHARAGTPEQWAKTGHGSDDLRPLTVDGRRRMRKAAAGLARVVPKLDAIGTSSLVRAVETAEIVAKAYGGGGGKHAAGAVAEVPDLAPGGERARVLAWVERQARRQDAVVALVGHEPGLGRLVGFLLCGRERPVVQLKKGSACLLDLPDPDAGRATLEWLLTPRQLRQLAKS